MLVDITPAALQHMTANGWDACTIILRQGGCFGFMSSLERGSSEFLIRKVNDVAIYVNQLIDDHLMIDFTNTLIRSGFVITSLNTKNCCCSKSFGTVYSKSRCSVTK